MASLVLESSGIRAESVRAQEAASCLAGEASTWPDGQDRVAAAGGLRLVYRHAGAPAGFDEAQVLNTVQRALAAWSGCGVPAEVFGEAAAEMIPGQVVRVLWDDAGSRGNFGLANLAQRTLSLGPASFALLAQRNPRPTQHTRRCRWWSATNSGTSSV